MASKKHRPIVMNRNKKPGRTFTILKKVLSITAILAFIEIIILVVIHFKNTNRVVVNIEEKPKEIPKEIPKQIPAEALIDTGKVVAVDLPKAIAENNHPDSTAEKDTVEIRKPVAIQPVTAKKNVLKDTAVIHEAKPKEIETVTQVSEEKMVQILNELRMEKMQANNPAKCVTIQIVNNSNAENGYKIANYLRQNGYVISGREVVRGTQKGIQIDAAGPCIKLAIGSL